MASARVPEGLGRLAWRLLIAGGGLLGAFFFFRRGRGGGRKPDRAFEEQLWTRVEAQVTAVGYGFEAEAEERYRQLIHSSVEKLGPPSKEIDAKTVQDVENAFARFTDEVITQAKLQGRNLIRWRDIQEALKKLCPLFPIC